MANMTETEMQEAQQRLVEKRQSLGVTPKPSTMPSIASSIKKFPIGPINERSPSFCDTHQVPLRNAEDGTRFCPKCFLAERRASSQEDTHTESSQREKRIIENRIKSLQIGKRYHAADFDNFVDVNEQATEIKTTCHRYAKTIKARIKSGDSLLLQGEPGTGKNHLAAAIAKAAIMEGFVVLHTTARRIGRRLRRCWDIKEDQEQVMSDLFLSPDLLVIDEITHSLNQTDTDSLTEILCERYHECRATILLANLDMETLSNKLGKHVIDRFYDTGSNVMILNWESFRQKPVANAVLVAARRS